MKNNKDEGITLIALVVTIVVLIILATVSINAVLGQNGIIGKAKQTKSVYEASRTNEVTAMEELANEMAQYDVKKEEGITVTVDGTDGIKLTKDNVADYLGKIVKDYKPTTDSVVINGTTYKVSQIYRLYYVDFDGKYGEKNSIYLKADCTGNNYALPMTDTTVATASNVKIKELNPSLYRTGVTSPSASNANMKAVTFLTNTSNWRSLKTGVSLADKVNYIVGSPSIEMMMDSYNTKYRLTGDTPDISALNESTNRVKLFYQYPTKLNSNNYGYEVGPCTYANRAQEYYYVTSFYSVKTDVKIDSLYYPGNNNKYWISSPSNTDNKSATDYVMFVSSENGGMVNSHGEKGSYALCPIVSLQSSASLQLQ